MTDRERTLAPTLAATTRPIAMSVRSLSCSSSTISPASAAIAGSRLMNNPNTFAAMLRSAVISNEYGMSDESSATTSPGKHKQ